MNLVPMNEMEERIARAMVAARWPEDDDWEDRIDQACYVLLARTAITAMREPSEAMVKAAQGLEVNQTVWRAMIDAALA